LLQLCDYSPQTTCSRNWTALQWAESESTSSIAEFPRAAASFFCGEYGALDQILMIKNEILDELISFERVHYEDAAHIETSLITSHKFETRFQHNPISIIDDNQQHP
jgi:hypothetical protein